MFKKILIHSVILSLLILVSYLFLNNNYSLLFLYIIIILSYKIFNNFYKNKKNGMYDFLVKKICMICALLSISITILIISSILFESIEFFKKESIWDFLFGTHWNPQTAIHSDQVASKGSFGIIPVISGTLMITFIALLVAVPIGLYSAIYLSEYSNDKLQNKVKPFLEILAGIPTVVYGYFAAVFFAPLINQLGKNIGLSISTESALIAGITIGIMIIPFVLSLSDDVMRAVPKSLRDASLALGATKEETIKKIILPSALPGITASVILAMSRAIGETMIVVMVVGLTANLTINPLESVTTVTVQMVTLLTGDQEFDSSKTLAAFALGLVLFVFTLILNIVALVIVKKYSDKYE